MGCLKLSHIPSREPFGSMYRLGARHFGACETAAALLLKLENSTDQEIRAAVFLDSKHESIMI